MSFNIFSEDDNGLSQHLRCDNDGCLKVNIDKQNLPDNVYNYTYKNDLRYQRRLGNCYVLSDTQNFSGNTNKKYILINENQNKNIFIYYIYSKLSDNSTQNYTLTTTLSIIDITSPVNQISSTRFNNLNISSPNITGCTGYRNGTISNNKIINEIITKFSTAITQEEVINENYLNEMIQIPPNKALLIDYTANAPIFADSSMNIRYLELEGDYPII